MSLTADDSELALLMPQRAGMPLMEYLSLVFLAGAEDLLRPALEQLEIQAGQSVLIYGPDPRDDGQLCHFQEWDMEALVPAILNMKFVDLPDLSGQISEQFLGALPQLLLRVRS